MRIENLTPDPVTLDAGRTAEVTIPASAQLAQVTVPAGRERGLPTAAGTVREVQLRRSGQRVTGLPPRRDGVVYLVPWLTALAARRRPDLVFAVDERRDPQGRGLGARALGRFALWSPPAWARAVGWRHPGWSWTVGRDWLTTSGFTAATLLLGAALGGIPVVAAGKWSDPQVRTQASIFTALAIAGLVFLAAAELTRRGRNAVLRRRGTAYIIKEEAREWARDQAQGFLASARRQFAGTLWVPGPGTLDHAWDWSLSDGPQQWDVKVAELVRSFQAVQFNQDPGSPTALFMWAWWPIAVAFGARITAGQRGLLLDVWQRPSYGRSGTIEPPDYGQRPHRFLRGDLVPSLAELLPESVPQEFTWRADVTMAPRAANRPAGAGGKTRGDGLTVLLVRLSTQPWGPVPAVPAEPDPAGALSLDLDDAAGLGLPGACRADIRELRCRPPTGGAFPWSCYPSLVGEVSGWLGRQAASLTGQTVLLGALMPPEVALGLGIDAGQGGSTGWPRHVWPIVYGQKDGRDALVVAHQNLGSAAPDQTGDR